MEFKPPSDKFKGEGTILILGLLKDDEVKDPEMKRMTDLLDKRVVETGRKVSRMDCSGSLDECRLTGGKTLYITGHSRFMEADTKIRSVPKRTLGGFELDAVVELLFKGVC